MRASCLIVGAGMAGLTAASVLRGKGLSVVVVDKGRNVGGRMATRTVGGGRFDHGAQFFTVRDARFRRAVARWESDGVVRPWFIENGHVRYRPAGGMRGLATHIAEGLQVRLETTIRSADPVQGGWRAVADTGLSFEAAALLLTAPAPQSAALLEGCVDRLPAGIMTALRNIAFDPCFALLVTLEGPSRIPAPGYVRLDEGPIEWIADNTQKGVSPGAAALTIHARADFSRRYLEAPQDEVARILLDEGQKWFEGEAAVWRLHRWRYSKPVDMERPACLFITEPAPLAIAGDAFGGSRIEAAFLSGLAAAERIAAVVKGADAVASLDSQRVRAQLELKDRALASSAEGITIADASLPDNPLIYANAGFEKLTGYSVAEVIGRNCRFLQGPGTDRTAVDELRTAVRNQQTVTVTLRNYRKDSTPFWNRLSITPVRDAAGAVTHFIGVQSDVTEEKQAKEELQRANERLEAASLVMGRDLAAAATVQRSLLPLEMPRVPGMEFAFKFRPCTEVGGDCLNVLALDDRHLGVYILDVAGHGVAAALLSVTLSHMLSVVPDRSFLYQPCPGNSRQHCIASPVDVVTRLNRRFSDNSASPQFFTMIYGILDTQTADFRYVSAGHLSPIYVPCGGPPFIREAGGIPAGLLPRATYEEHSVKLSKGDRLYLCTDGILESENRAEEEFGVGRLLDTLTQNRDLPLDESLSVLLRCVEEWSAPVGPSDDASLLAIERSG